MNNGLVLLLDNYNYYYYYLFIEEANMAVKKPIGRWIFTKSKNKTLGM